MAVPRFVDNAADFAAAVKKGDPESKFLDFKKTLDGWDLPKGAPDKERQKAQKELCRDVVQFANTDGGCLLIGIAEHLDTATRLKVADDFVGVVEPDGIRAWSEQSIENYVTPKTFTHSIVPVTLPSGAVMVAVNVPPSRYMVSLWDRSDGTIEYPYRTSHGKARMNPGEAETHIMGGTRFGRITIEQALAKYEVVRLAEIAAGRAFLYKIDLVSGVFQRIAGGAWTRWPNPLVELCTPLDEKSDTFGITVSPLGNKSRLVQIPYGAVRDAWVGKDRNNAPAMGLLLSLRLVTLDKGEVVLEA